MSFPKIVNQMGSVGEKRKKLFFRFCRPILDIFGFPLLNTLRVKGLWPQKRLPLFPDPPSVKKLLTKSFIPVGIGPKSFCKAETSDGTGS